MSSFLPIIQIVIAALLMIAVLLQQRGTALGGAFGDSGGFYATRRGIQDKLYWITIILGIIFIVLAILNLTL